MKKNDIKWIKIGSKGSSYLARHNAAYKAVNKYMKEISGIPILLDNYKYIDHTHYGSLSYPQELEKLYSIIHKRIGGVEGYSRLRKDNYKKYFKEIKKLASGIDNKLNNKKLIEIYLNGDDVYAKANSFLGLGTLYTDYLSRKLQNKYGEKYFEFDISSKTKLSQYNDDLLRLSRIKNKSKLEKAIDKILKKYYWIGSFFLIGDELDRKRVLEDMKNAQKTENKKIIRIKLPSDLLVQEMKRLSRDRNEELEEFMELEYYFKKILDEIARRLRVDFETLTYFSPNEIVNCLKGKSLSLNNIKQRRKLFGFLIKNGEVSEYCGNKAKFLIERQNKKSKEIKGFVACRRDKKIKGIVRMIHKSADIKKVKKGDILVTIMTTPNYMQAIYNAAAIITDEGGITCHAAIISRELNKPCVIGTKIATRILRDGDYVEVDADRGIVIKLKDAKRSVVRRKMHRNNRT